MTPGEINEAVHRKLYPYADLAHKNPIDFCHDIKAAWEIVEKKQFSIILSHGEYMVGNIDESGTMEKFYCDPLAPMAIALAFLKLHDNSHGQ